MGIENMVNIIFKGQQDTSITRLERGNVALLLQDREQEVGQFVIKDYTEIPKGLNEKNKRAIRLVLDTGANKVIAVITKLTTVVTWNPETDEIFKKMDALDFDFLALPGITNQDALKVASWAKKTNEKARHRFKVVLPKTAGDDEHIINFAHDNIIYKGEKYKTEDFTAYIAGFIAKTEPTRSITNAKAIGVDSVDFMSNEEVNTATKEELMQLKGIGQKKAEDILNYRGANGEFQKIEDIQKVPGLKKGAFEKIKDQITVS